MVNCDSTLLRRVQYFGAEKRVDLYVRESQPPLEISRVRHYAARSNY